MTRIRYKTRSVKKRKCYAKVYLTVENRVLLNIYANFRHVYLESKFDTKLLKLIDLFLIRKGSLFL